MQRAEHEVACLGRGYRGLDGVFVPHLADQYDVRVFAKACAQAVLLLSSLDAEAAARRAEASVSEYSLERVLPQVMEQYLSLLRDREDK